MNNLHNGEPSLAPSRPVIIVYKRVLITDISVQVFKELLTVKLNRGLHSYDKMLLLSVIWQGSCSLHTISHWLIYGW